jgi:hypothetical protein
MTSREGSKIIVKELAVTLGSVAGYGRFGNFN